MWSQCEWKMNVQFFTNLSTPTSWFTHTHTHTLLLLQSIWPQCCLPSQITIARVKSVCMLSCVALPSDLIVSVCRSVISRLRAAQNQFGVCDCPQSDSLFSSSASNLRYHSLIDSFSQFQPLLSRAGNYRMTSSTTRYTSSTEGHEE